MKLYSHPVQPNALRVLMFMDEKGIDLPVVNLDLFAGEHKSPEHLDKNPRGQMPALELDDGATISESIVICRFLDESFGEPKLFGTDMKQRAQISMWERVLELGIFIPSVEYGHHTLPEMKPHFDQYPAWAESLRGGIEKTLDMLARRSAFLEIVMRLQRLFRAVNWKYAIGEFLLIVLGITFALGANSCYADRQARVEEQDYLRRIRASLDA